MSQRDHLRGPGHDNCRDCGDLTDWEIRGSHHTVWILESDIPRLERDVADAQRRLDERRDLVSLARKRLHELVDAGDEVRR